MKVIFVTQYTALYGGNLSMLGLIDGLKKQGVIPHVLAPGEGDLAPELKKRNVEYTVIPFELSVQWKSTQPVWHPLYWKNALGNWIRERGRNKKNKSLLESFKNEIAGLNAQLIYSNSITINFGLYLAQAISTPHLWHIREFGDLDWNAHPDFGPTRRKEELSSSTALLFNSIAVEQHHLKEITHPQTRVIYDGVMNEEEFHQYGGLPTPNLETGFHLGILGLIKQSKGQATAIDALALLKGKHSNLHLHVFGSGEIDVLEKKIKAHQLEDQIHLHGYQKDLKACLSQCHGILMCSTNEAFGRVTVEGLASKRPVIGLRNGGTAEILKDGKYGLIYKGSTQQLAEKIHTLVQDYESYRGRSEDAWEYARSSFSNEHSAEQVFELFKQTINETPDS